MSSDTQQILLDKVLSEYDAIIQKYYPNIRSDGMGYAGPNFHHRFSIRYKDYKDTPFFYNDRPNLVHWTTLSNLSSIINNSELRLYSLHNSEDVDEFNYAAKLLDLSEQQINILKENIFTASFCSIDDLKNELLWKRYGRNYEGIAIVFSVVEEIDDWKNFFLSKIYYDLDRKFKEFQDELNALKEKYNNGPTFINDIWKFAGFYKKTQYSDENEIRLACILPFPSQIDSLKYIRKELRIQKDRNRIVGYLPLKLWVDPNSSYHRTLDLLEIKQNTFDYYKPELPKLKIESIYFGENCGLTKEEYWKFSNELKTIFSWKLGYDVEIPLNLFP